MFLLIASMLVIQSVAVISPERIAQATPDSTAPSMPQLLRPYPGKDRITLFFVAPATDGGEAVTDYEWSLDGVTWTPAGTTSPIVVPGLSASSDFVLRLRAINSVGASPAAEVGVRTTAQPVVVYDGSSAERDISSLLTDALAGGDDADSLQLLLSSDDPDARFRIPTAAQTGLTGLTGYPTLTQLNADAGTVDLGVSGTRSAIRSAAIALVLKSALPEVTVSIGVIPGQEGVTFDPVEQRFYQFINSSVTWVAARCLAKYSNGIYSSEADTYDKCVLKAGHDELEFRELNGLRGYLATSTSAAENAFLTSRAGAAAAWLGGSDEAITRAPGSDTNIAASEGTWRWVDGPEASVNFWLPVCGTGLKGLCSAAGGTERFNNWNDGEPNNAGTEGALQILAGGAGRWNDLAINSPTLPYIVEYGGFPGETITGAVATSGVLVQHLGFTPGPPRDATVTFIGSAEARIDWAAPENDGGEAITGYEVRYRLAGTDAWSGPEALTASTTTVTITGLASGTTSGACSTPGAICNRDYEFEIQAKNSLGLGDAARVAFSGGSLKMSDFVTGDWQWGNYFWRGYVFTLTEDIIVTHLVGGGGRNCRTGEVGRFEGAIFSVTWPAHAAIDAGTGLPNPGSITSSTGPRPQVGTVLGRVQFRRIPPDETAANEANVRANEQTVPVRVRGLGGLARTPEGDLGLLLRALDDDGRPRSYLIGQGDSGGGNNCHNRTNTLDVSNIIASPAVARWFPDVNGAFNLGGSGAATGRENGGVSSSLDPILPLVGFDFVSAVLPAQLTTLAPAGDAPLVPRVRLDSTGGGDTTVFIRFGREVDDVSAPTVITGTLATTGLTVREVGTIAAGASPTVLGASLTGLLPSTTYYYQGLATNFRGTVTSSILSFATPAAPSAPTISVSPGDGSLSAAFTPVEGATNYAYSLDGGSWILRSPASAASPLVITGLTNGQEYAVRIRAISGGVEGTPSNEVSATPVAAPPPPPAPPAPPIIVTPPPLPSGPVVVAGVAPRPSPTPTARLGEREVSVVPTPAGTVRTQGTTTVSTATILQVGSVSLALDVTGAGEVRTAGGAAPQVSVVRDRVAQTSGGGMLPGTQVQAWLPLAGGNARPVTAIPVREDGTFTGELPFDGRTDRQTDGRPLPIGTHVLQLVGVDAAGQVSVIEQTVRIEQPSPAPEPDRRAGAPPTLRPGASIATNAGVPEAVRVVPVPEVRQARVEGTGWTMAVDIPSADGRVAPAEGGGALIELVEDDVAEVSGDGFLPGTRADVWLFSTPTLLGTVTIGPDGSFSGQVPVAGIATGEHTLQLQGVGRDGYVRAANLGVAVVPRAADEPAPEPEPEPQPQPQPEATPEPAPERPADSVEVVTASGPEPTGSSLLVWIALLAAVLGSGGWWFLIGRRRRDDEDEAHQG